MTASAIYKMIKHMAKEAGLSSEVTTHSLRHTFGTNSIKLGTINQVQKLMGHESITTTTIYTHISVRELAAFFHYSERQISCLIKEYTGMNFPDLIRHLKLSRACELLTNPDLPVTTVMETVGYADLSSFYKAFKACYGMTPAQFREQLHASDIRPSRIRTP